MQYMAHGFEKCVGLYFFQLDNIPTLYCFSDTAVISIPYDYDLSCFLGTLFSSLCLIVRCGMFSSEAFSRYENFIMKRTFSVSRESF